MSMFQQKDDTIIFRTEGEVKQQLIALSFVWGFEGVISPAIRQILRITLPQVVESFDKTKKEEYQKTLDYLQKEEQLKQAQILGVIGDTNGNDK